MSRVFSGLGALLVGWVLNFSAVSVQADESSGFFLRGFGTVGVSRTNTPNAEFVRDLSQPRGVKDSWSFQTDSLLGLQANYQFSHGLEGVVQAVSRYRYDKTYTPDITWAYLKFDPTANISLRAGRLGTEFFMLSDSRLVGYSYLTVRPPVDFFTHLPFYSIEGADAAVSLPLGEGLVRAKVFSGISHEKVALADEMWRLSGSRMSGVYVDYLDGPWTLRASFADIRFSNNLPIDKTLNAFLPPNLAAEGARFLATEKKHATYYSLGVVYDRGPWQLQLMLNDIHQGSKAFENSWAGYGLAAYRMGSLTPYVGYSKVVSKVRDDPVNAVVARVMADSHVDQETWMLGARWDFARNLALKVQMDAVRGTLASIFPFRRENTAWSGDMNIFSATLDFVF